MFGKFLKICLENLEKIFGKFLKKILQEVLKKYLEIFEKMFDISQGAAPQKHHVSYDESIKKFNGGVVVLVAYLNKVSLQVLTFEILTMNVEY